MCEVEELFAGASHRTRIWMSKACRKAVNDYCRKREKHRGMLLHKLKRQAEAGFGLFEGPQSPIRHEWDGVYRVGYPIDLFRILGFYEDGSRRNFIAIDAYTKHGQKLSATDRHRIDAVAKIKRDGQWRKRGHDGDYPRIAR